MKTLRFTPEQIAAILKSSELGRKTDDICRENGISSSTFYKWRSQMGGMSSADIAELKRLKAENASLKTMVADLSLENRGYKKLLAKKY